jgi:hypothetical protein
MNDRSDGFSKYSRHSNVYCPREDAPQNLISFSENKIGPPNLSYMFLFRTEGARSLIHEFVYRSAEAAAFLR